MSHLQYLFVIFILVSPFLHIGSMKLSLGVDYGTSGLRVTVIDSVNKDIFFESSRKWDRGEITSPSGWINNLFHMINTIPIENRSKISLICVSGTSSTALLFDQKQGRVCKSPLLYNYNIFSDPSRSNYGKIPWKTIKQEAPMNSAVVSTTSTLMKLLSWHDEHPLHQHHRLLHQADYVSNYLLNRLINTEVFYSDWHNSLKLGYDVDMLQYPAWLLNLIKSLDLPVEVLPKVVQPGKSLGVIDSLIAQQLLLSPSCEIIAGTTDSIAAFLASGCESIGEAVTSLGSTMVIKALSHFKIEDSSLGIYSHRLGDNWLVGGASNVGCQIFREEGFSEEDLLLLTRQMKIDSIPFAEYYPLTKPGERFPVNDPNLLPITHPRPDDRKDFLFSLFHSIAKIESDAYKKLESLGATPVRRIYTAGGGSKNDFWLELRSKVLDREVLKARNTEASYGAALLGCRCIP